MAEIKNQGVITADPSSGTAPTDTQMLDWLAANCVTSYCDDGEWWLTSASGYQGAEYPTLRAAITAAMTGADPCL